MEWSERVLNDIVMILGGRMLERSPQGRGNRAELVELYHQALTEFQEFCRLDWRLAFEPPPGFDRRVLGYVRSRLIALGVVR